MNPSEYHALGRSDNPAEMWLSKSHLWKFGQSPFAWRFGPPMVITDAMRWGSLVDCLVTTPELFGEEYAIAPFADFRTKAAQEWRDKETRVVITRDMAQEATEAAKAMESHLARHGLQYAEPQKHAIRELEVQGTIYTVKALADLVAVDAIHDIKTTGDIGERAIRNTIAERGYHVQGALYCDLFGMEKFSLHFQERNAPYRTRRVDLDDRDMHEGRAWYLAAIERWHECVTTDTWPGAELETLTGGLPAWFGK